LRRSLLFLSLALVLCVGLLMVGCGKKAETPAPGTQPQAEKLSGSIQIAGSTSVQPLSEELAKAFMAKHPDVKINVSGGGSGAGIKGVTEGTVDIGASSRELKPEEKGKVKEFVIAKDGIAVIVNPKNPVDNLTMDQIRDIYAGKITNWKEVGGKDAPITVVTREEGSGTRGAFTEIVMGKEKITDKAVVQNSTGAVRTAVASNENAIGYISLGALSPEVKALKVVDGVEATKDNVLKGTYKLSRPFLYLTKEEPKEVVKAYIDFVLSPEGQKIVEKEYIPVKPTK